MRHATNEQHSKVMEALAAVGRPYLPDTQEAQREALYNALYDLACQGVIPPEVKLDVQIVREGPDSWAFQFSKDFMDWMRP